MTNPQILFACRRKLPVLLVALAANCTAIADSISSAGSMSESRMWHTATLLYDGRLVVAGGTGGDYLASAEIYDGASGWSLTGTMNHAHAYHTAVRLNDGSVLVAGGTDENGGNTKSTELFDPSVDEWSTVGDLNVARSYHTATLLRDGTVLVTGGLGDDGALSSAEIYNPSTGEWTLLTSSMTHARYWHTATLLPNGKVLVAGGWGSPGTAEIFDPGSLTWSAAANMNVSRIEHAATLLPSGLVLVTGGGMHPYDTPETYAELYNATNNAWTETGEMSSDRCAHTATLLQDGTVLVAGGYGVYNYLDYLGDLCSLPNTEIYNPTNGVFTAGPSLSDGRGSHSGTMLCDGTVLMAGGEGADGSLASAELYSGGLKADCPTVSYGHDFCPDFPGCPDVNDSDEIFTTALNDWYILGNPEMELHGYGDHTVRANPTTGQTIVSKYPVWLCGGHCYTLGATGTYVLTISTTGGGVIYQTLVNPTEIEYPGVSFTAPCSGYCFIAVTAVNDPQACSWSSVEFFSVASAACQ